MRRDSAAARGTEPSRKRATGAARAAPKTKRAAAENGSSNSTVAGRKRVPPPPLLLVPLLLVPPPLLVPLPPVLLVPPPQSYVINRAIVHRPCGMHDAAGAVFCATAFQSPAVWSTASWAYEEEASADGRKPTLTQTLQRVSDSLARTCALAALVA